MRLPALTLPPDPLMPTAPDCILAAHAMGLPDPPPSGAAPPEWVHLLPLGVANGFDGRGPYRIGDKASAEAVIAASRSYGKGLPLAIDYDHATDLAAPRGERAPAAGWITALEARQDGIWGRSEWTPAAAAALKDREYRYISPAFHHAKDGKVLRLVRASLVNGPNLDLTALAAARTGNQQPPAGDVMDLNHILTAAGLPAGTTAEAALAAIKGLAAAKADLERIATAAGLPAGADGAALATGVTAMRAQLAAAKSATAPDPAQWVPMALYTALAASAQAARIGAVDEAIKAGKLTPGQREWAVAYQAQDPGGFTKFVQDAPVLVTAGALVPPGAPPGVPQGAITDGERAIASQLGITEQDFLKARGVISSGASQ
jgi:phage I-like protein